MTPTDKKLTRAQITAAAAEKMGRVLDAVRDLRELDQIATSVAE